MTASVARTETAAVYSALCPQNGSGHRPLPRSYTIRERRQLNKATARLTRRRLAAARDGNTNRA